MALIKITDPVSGKVLFEKDTEQDSGKGEIQPERKPSKASKKAPVNKQSESSDGLL